LLALALLASGAHAQSAAESPTGHELSTEDRWLLDGRDREMLHAGMPVELIGLDEGDATFRTRTPLLANSDQAVILVDAEENYARRLAMYETGERFHAPPPRSSAASSSSYDRSGGGRALESSRSGGSAPVQEEQDTSTRNLVSLLLSVVLAAFVALRRK
jgi:hypothetical protein